MESYLAELHRTGMELEKKHTAIVSPPVVDTILRLVNVPPRKTIDMQKAEEQLFPSRHCPISPATTKNSRILWDTDQTPRSKVLPPSRRCSGWRRAEEPVAVPAGLGGKPGAASCVLNTKKLFGSAISYKRLQLTSVVVC